MRSIRRSLSSIVLLIAVFTLAVACSDDDDLTTSDSALRQGGSSQVTATTGDGALIGAVTVIGEGTSSATPDAVRFTVGVEVMRPDVASAFADANATQETILEALRAEGVADEDLRTTRFSLREQREQPPEPMPGHPGTDPRVSGYVVTNMVEVTTDEVERAGQLIATAVDAGGDAARVDQVHYVVDAGRETQRSAARSEAFADARRRAEQYADLADRTLGELVSVSEVFGSDGPMGTVFTEAADAATAPPLEPGRQDIAVRIQATWALADPND